LHEYKFPEWYDSDDMLVITIFIERRNMAVGEEVDEELIMIVHSI
jgi:hypothetical protein